MQNLKIVSIMIAMLFCLQTVNAEWVKRNTNSFAWFKDVFFLDQNHGWIVGTDGVLISTDDGGSTWEQSRKFT
ncbi:MAG: YCF48-related protein, partial [Pyrinomonadaceae bacterium]